MEEERRLMERGLRPAIEALPAKKYKPNPPTKCPHPGIYCENGWSLCDYTDGGEFCTVCEKWVCTDLAKCYEVCDKSCPDFRKAHGYDEHEEEADDDDDEEEADDDESDDDEPLTNRIPHLKKQ